MHFFKKELLIIILTVFVSTVLLWLPFGTGLEQFLGYQIPPGGMKTIWANYDGPNYLVIAKTWYQQSRIARMFSLPLPLEYYPAHFPGYPLLIFILGKLFGFPQAMLLATLLTTTTAAIIFYSFLKKFFLSSNPLWLTIVFLFLPPRIFAVRSVGAPEMLFITVLLASIYYFRQNKYFQAGFWAALFYAVSQPIIT
ncbi:hypothetical protein ACFLZP_02360, partial [Patescibacteria group bacterium]